MQDFDWLLACGLISAALSVYAFLLYAIDTIRRRTRPQRASWFIWSALASISFAAQIAEGAQQSLWFAGTQTIGTVIIFLIGFRRGVGGVGSVADLCILAIAGLGLYAWSATNDPAYALVLAIGVSFLGGIVTVSKAYASPSSETMSTWVVCFIATIFAILSVGRLDWLLLAYPLYLFTLYGAILVAMWSGKRRAVQVVPIGSVA